MLRPTIGGGRLVTTALRRGSTRIRGYDYSAPGAYFVTLCARGKECVFGEVVDGEARLNETGTIIEVEWFRSADIRQEIALDAFIVMPNHLHGIVIINPKRVGAHGSAPSQDSLSGGVGAHGRAPLQRRSCSLGSFVAGFKASATKRINDVRGTPGRAVWQRNYYEHVIRGDDDLARIRTYITENPLRWELDEENPRRREATKTT